MHLRDIKDPGYEIKNGTNITCLMEQVKQVLIGNIKSTLKDL